MNQTAYTLGLYSNTETTRIKKQKLGKKGAGKKKMLREEWKPQIIFRFPFILLKDTD